MYVVWARRRGDPIAIPHSSWISLIAAAIGASSGSTFPPGADHIDPLGDEFSTTRIDPRRRIKPDTTNRAPDRIMDRLPSGLRQTFTLTPGDECPLQKGSASGMPNA
jgi:hypothetical protein